MDHPDVVQAAFLDELEKIAVSSKLLAHAQSRRGRRPMRVDTLLRKEKEGTFYRKVTEAWRKQAESGGTIIPYSATDWQTTGMRSSKKPYESVEQTIKREDSRDITATINSPARQVMGPSGDNYPNSMDVGR